jgi:hypothetical protein
MRAVIWADRVELAREESRRCALRISLARRSSRTSRSNSMMRCPSAVVVPGRWPSSISAWRTQMRNDSVPTPNWRATRPITPLCSPVCLRTSNTIRTARWRISSRVGSAWHGSILSKDRNLHKTRGDSQLDSRPGRAHRKEKLGVFVQTRCPVAPIHGRSVVSHAHSPFCSCVIAPMWHALQPALLTLCPVRAGDGAAAAPRRDGRSWDRLTV